MKDMRFKNHNLFITTANTVYVYNNQMVLLRQINNSDVAKTTLSFTCATAVGDDIYIGTDENGLYVSKLSGALGFENMMPIGPSRNDIFAINVTPTVLWAVYGNYKSSNNPYPLDSYGISKFNTTGWLNIPYEKVLQAKSMTRVIVNPNNENQVYASSFFSGLLKIENDTPSILYNQANSGLGETGAQLDIRGPRRAPATSSRGRRGRHRASMFRNRGGSVRTIHLNYSDGSLETICQQGLNTITHTTVLKALEQRATRYRVRGRLAEANTRTQNWGLDETGTIDTSGLL